MNYEKDFLPPLCHSSKTLRDVAGIVLHHISAVNTYPENPYSREAIKDIFIDNGVSAHLLIERDGNVVQLMPLHLEAWHAGPSMMHGVPSCNHWTLGIELVATPTDDFTSAQYSAVAEVCRNAMQDYGFPQQWIAGHREVRAEWLAKHPDPAVPRKYDPNSNFDWQKFRGMLYAR